MKIKEITESIGNGSFFSLGPKSLNQPHHCVDQYDPTCPGHKAGVIYQYEHPDEPIDTTSDAEEVDPQRPSFTNGRQQAARMMQKDYTAIGVNITTKGKRGYQKTNFNYKFPKSPTNNQPPTPIA
jgi:hypothetical protein